MSSVSYAGMNALSASLNGALRGPGLLNASSEKAVHSPTTADSANGATSTTDTVTLSEEARDKGLGDALTDPQVQSYNNLSSTHVVDTDYDQFNRVLDLMFM